MMTDTSLPQDPVPNGAPADTAEPIRRRKRRARVQRQDKFPRPVRLALWLGLPAALWAGIYLIGRALF